MEQELYIHDIYQTSLNVSSEQADRWLEHLVEALRESTPDVTGHGISLVQPSADFPYPHRELHINGVGGELIDTPRLKIVPLGTDREISGMYVFLGAKRPITEADVAKWKTAIDSAVSRLSQENPEFEWAAVLGQLNDPTTQKYALRKTAHVGAIIVRSGKVQHISIMPGQIPSFFGSSFSITWPVVIEGKLRGHNWLAASRQAGKDTHLMAALISLAWNSTWKLIHSPQNSPQGQLKVPRAAAGQTHTPRHMPHPKKYRALPKWVTGAAALTQTNSSISNALSSYYQGVLMQDPHPSFALVAFVAAIESIGGLIIGNRCSCCGKPNGSNQKFRAGLHAVIADEAEVKRLAEAYGSRSETAHEGKLHGTETALGAIAFPSIFNPDAADLFAFTDLLKIRQVARKLLIKALKGRL